ncbi:MAG: APC family permease [Pseudobdellovibrio sp.]
MFVSKIRRILIGDPLHNSQQSHELIPKWKALALLAADALSSIAYATEEIIIPLALVSVTLVTWSLPIALAILGLMFIITLSYRQTINNYPNGGGAYIVAKENLGKWPGLVAGAALLIDYTLTVAVSVSAGVENLVSAFPAMASVQVFTCVWIILLLMVLSLRGIKDSATIFAIPTYLFIFSIFLLIITGLVRGPTDPAIHSHEVLLNNMPEISMILLLKAFSSGCTALTGIEAVSNGIPLFKHPQSKNANATLLMMIFILGSMFAGITYLVNSYDLLPMKGVTLISSLSKAVFGAESILFYLVQISVFLILFMAASTAYADFPRLSSLLAIDRYAPRQLASVGDRLVFSNGIIGLSLGAIGLVIFFGGHTHSLIPLYAVGVFLSFTLSQAGMVVHHWKLREKGWIPSMLMNGLGTIVTFCVLIVIGSFKFTHGAWLVVIVIPIIVYSFHRIHVHYVMFARELSQSHHNIERCDKVTDHVVVIPISGLHRGVMNAIRYGKSISTDIRVCFVKTDDLSAQRMLDAWNAKFPDSKLYVLDSPYRSISEPILNFIDDVRKEHPTEFITVIFPEFVTFKWYHQLLHNQTAWLIKLSLIYKKNVIVTSVKYHLSTT